METNILKIAREPSKKVNIKIVLMYVPQILPVKKKMGGGGMGGGGKWNLNTGFVKNCWYIWDCKEM